MTNSNGDNFTERDPMAETEFGSQMSERDSRFQEGARKISQAASETWDQTRQKAGVVRERTEVFLRENPVPTVLGALVLGLAIGLAIRYSSRQEEPTLIGETRPARGGLEYDHACFSSVDHAQREEGLRRLRRSGQERTR